MARISLLADGGGGGSIASRSSLVTRKKTAAMAGTDSRKALPPGPSPCVILVNPQLGENIGTAARAMANFGLSELRIVQPRDGWPNAKALSAASGADARSPAPRCSTR